MAVGAEAAAMSKAVSLDLREWVLRAMAEGASHRQAGLRFGVSAASVSRWRALERRQGDLGPGRSAGIEHDLTRRLGERVQEQLHEPALP